MCAEYVMLLASTAFLGHTSTEAHTLLAARRSGKGAEQGLHVHAGYGEPGFLASYLGVQAHGILWPAPGATASANWPIAPPMVSAKVRS